MFYNSSVYRHIAFRCLIVVIFCGAHCAGFTPVASAKTTRKAEVRVQNKTGRKISIVSVFHKYSDNFKDTKVWKNLPPERSTTETLSATYNTGFGTTGRDWWQVLWQFEDEPKLLYVTNPNNLREFADALEGVAADLLPILAEAVIAEAGGPEGSPVTEGVSKALSSALFNSESTIGFKQHILRSDDEGKFTTIVIFNDKVEFVSPSGNSTTGIEATAPNSP